MSTTQSKTVREWFNELPEPIRGMALENIFPENEGKIFKSLKDALQLSFWWSETKQDYDFWEYVWFGRYDKALACIGIFDQLLTAAKDTVAKEEYGAIGWFMLKEHQQAHLVDKVAIKYNELLTSKQLNIQPPQP